MALSDVGFGYHDSEPLCQLTSLCGDFIKKEFTAITQDAWRTSALHWTGLCSHWRSLREVARKLRRARVLVFKNVGNIFSICCNYTFLAYKLFITFAISLKNRNKKMMVYSWSDVFAFYTGHRRPFVGYEFHFTTKYVRNYWLNITYFMQNKTVPYI
jgi:hypothetical protein